MSEQPGDDGLGHELLPVPATQVAGFTTGQQSSTESDGADSAAERGLTCVCCSVRCADWYAVQLQMYGFARSQNFGRSSRRACGGASCWSVFLLVVMLFQGLLYLMPASWYGTADDSPYLYALSFNSVESRLSNDFAGMLDTEIQLVEQPPFPPGVVGIKDAVLGGLVLHVDPLCCVKNPVSYTHLTLPTKA